MNYKLFNGLTYKTKSDCRKAWREIVQKTPSNEWGKELDETTHIKKSDIDFLIDNYCDRWYEYAGYKFLDSPVVSFSIKQSGYFNKGFDVLHLEGTNEEGFTDAITQQNFSCFGTGWRLNEKINLNCAFRGTIIKQMCDFKYSSENTCCNICSENITHESAEADHASPLFFEIVNNFKKEKNYSDDYLFTLLMKGSKLPQAFLDSTGLKFKLSRYWYYLYGQDQKIHKEFAQYHKEHAVLQYLCKECHKEKTRKENRERSAA